MWDLMFINHMISAFVKKDTLWKMVDAGTVLTYVRVVLKIIAQAAFKMLKKKDLAVYAKKAFMKIKINAYRILLAEP